MTSIVVRPLTAIPWFALSIQWIFLGAFILLTTPSSNCCGENKNANIRELAATNSETPRCFLLCLCKAKQAAPKNQLDLCAQEKHLDGKWDVFAIQEMNTGICSKLPPHSNRE